MGGGLVQQAVQADHVAHFKQLFHGLHPSARHWFFPLGFEEFAVRLHVRFQLFGWDGIEVHQIHLVSFHHHFRVCGANPARADDAHCFPLQQLSHEEVWKPSFVLSVSHERVGFDDAPCRREGERGGDFRRGFGQHAGCVAHWYPVGGCSSHVDVVVSHCIVAVRFTTGLAQGLEQRRSPIFGELSNDAVALRADELLDVFHVQDGFFGRAHFHAASVGHQHVQPSRAWQVFRHHHAMFPVRLVHLHRQTAHLGRAGHPTGLEQAVADT
mmetsp:Transcript_7131/g.44207  ORF Transcript_7131/g.44207 Transcript_7131/m.44207 type:complete len:269 (-) Transcript_7131:103-909(-)